MRIRLPLLGWSVFLLVGCMEGQKPAPLPRPSAGQPAASVAAKPDETPPAKPDEPSQATKAEPVAVDPLGREILPPPTVESAKSAAQPSLYQRLGGEAGITKVVNDFVTIVAADENIKEKHRKHFLEGDVALLKKKLVDQIGEATGGPQKYTGKNMKDAHKGLEITNKDFNALAADLVKALDMNKVPEDAKKELLAMLETMRKDVVERED